MVFFMGWNLNLVGLRVYWNQIWDAEEEIMCECLFFYVCFDKERKMNEFCVLFLCVWVNIYNVEIEYETSIWK